MSPQFAAYLWVALASPFVLAGIIAFALLRGYRDRPTPVWAKWTGASTVEI